MIKSVNDTNVWIAGINWDRGAGYQIRLHWEARRFQHFIPSTSSGHRSAEILHEIIRVLREVFEYPDEKLYDWYWLPVLSLSKGCWSVQYLWSPVW